MLTRLFVCLALIAAAAPGAAAALQAEFVRASTADLDNPHDLKLSPDGTLLLVADVGNNRVALLDPDTLAPVGSFGADRQSGTHDVDFDSEGKLYVADTHNNRILVYALSGTDAEAVGEIRGGFRGPEGVLAHPNGRIYVAGAWSGNLVAFEDGKPVAELTGLSSPHDVELAPGGDIWLADAGNDRMLLLSPELSIKRQLKGPPYHFNGVRYQDVLPDGTLVAADKNTHRVLAIASDGTIRLVLGTGEAGIGPGRFTTPEGVEISGDRLWLSDSGNDRIVLYRLDGL